MTTKNWQGNPVPKGHTRHYINDRSRRQSTVVSLQLIHCAPRHEKSHGCTNVDWKRLYVHGIKKLKLNTKSSTKAKFTTTDGDKALARSTECTHTNNNIYHDNKSTRLLSANGRLSSSKITNIISFLWQTRYKKERPTWHTALQRTCSQISSLNL